MGGREVRNGTGAWSVSKFNHRPRGNMTSSHRKGAGTGTLVAVVGGRRASSPIGAAGRTFVDKDCPSSADAFIYSPIRARWEGQKDALLAARYPRRSRCRFRSQPSDGAPACDASPTSLLVARGPALGRVATGHRRTRLRSLHAAHGPPGGGPRSAPTSISSMVATEELGPERATGRPSWEA